MTKGTGKLRIWGRATSSTRFSRDPGRRRKQHAFVIDVGRTAKPVVTPDDPDAFRAALTMAGVPISTAARRGAGQRSQPSRGVRGTLRPGGTHVICWAHQRFGP
jgi:hypothetical protein